MKTAQVKNLDFSFVKSFCSKSLSNHNWKEKNLMNWTLIVGPSSSGKNLSYNGETEIPFFWHIFIRRNSTEQFNDKFNTEEKIREVGEKEGDIVVFWW